MVREAALADRFGLSRGSLRNYRDAVALVRAIPDPTIRKALFGWSAASAAQMVRWMQRDAQAAASFLAQRSSAGPREIIAAEQATMARTVRRGWSRIGSIDEAVTNSGTSTLALPRDLVAALHSHDLLRDQQFPSLQLGRMGRPQDDLAQFYRIDRLIPLVNFPDDARVDAPEASGTSSLQAALVEVGRYGLMEQYGADARLLWARAVTASSAYPLVIVVFPGPASRRRFLGALPTRFKGVTRPERSKGGVRGMPLVFPADGLGGVLITSRLNAFSDLGIDRSDPG